jgi:hypothetical protein
MDPKNYINSKINEVFESNQTHGDVVDEKLLNSSFSSTS